MYQVRRDKTIIQSLYIEDLKPDVLDYSLVLAIDKAIDRKAFMLSRVEISSTQIFFEWINLFNSYQFLTAQYPSVRSAINSLSNIYEIYVFDKHKELEEYYKVISSVLK